MELSKKSRAILEAIAMGLSYDQILKQDASLHYPDIFKAAAEALDFINSAQAGKSYDFRMAQIKTQYARAYAPWEAAEDDQLRQLVTSGKRVKEIAETLQRQPSAIRSRMEKHGLKPSPAGVNASRPVGI